MKDIDLKERSATSEMKLSMDEAIMKEGTHEDAFFPN